jgi:hypothetical protein
MNGLFRGVRIDGIGEAVGNLIHAQDKYYIFREGADCRLNNSPVCDQLNLSVLQVHRMSIAQQTGREDKNQKPIYGSIEIDGKMTQGGDRLKTKNGVFPVMWYSDRAGFRALLRNIVVAARNWHKHEIIGTQWKGE